VEKESTKEQFIIKMINIGQEETKVQKKAQKKIAAKINILKQKCPFLFRYSKLFFR
jgi:hypothetical protein